MHPRIVWIMLESQERVHQLFVAVTNYPRAQWLKTASICYLTVSLDQKFRSSLAEWLWLRVSQEATVRMSGACGLHWVQRIGFQDGSLTWLLARGLHSSLCGPLPRAAGVSSNGSQQHPDLVIKEKTRQLPQCLYVLVSEGACITSAVPQWPRRPTLIQQRRDHHTVNVGGHDQHHWSFWKLVTTGAFAFS